MFQVSRIQNRRNLRFFNLASPTCPGIATKLTLNENQGYVLIRAWESHPFWQLVGLGELKCQKNKDNKRNFRTPLYLRNFQNCSEFSEIVQKIITQPPPGFCLLFCKKHLLKGESNLDQDLIKRKACIKKKYDQIQLALIEKIITSLERGDFSDFHDTNG